jgi:hypothetical protein
MAAGTRSRERPRQGDTAISTPTTSDDDLEGADDPGKVPREVRSIRRRLEQHERAAVESSANLHALQGQIDRMMNFMIASFAKLETSEKNQTVEISAQQGHTFTTPPPLPHHSLSPIPEVSTPAPSPVSIPLAPPQFGVLTPDKLPHPTYPPNTQTSQYQNTAPIYTNTAPLVTTQQHSYQPSSSYHVYQNTNPSSNPQMYNFSHPPYTEPYPPHQFQPPYSSPNPTYYQHPYNNPYPPPQYNQHPYYNPYPPPPHYQPPYQPNHNMIQYTQPTSLPQQNPTQQHPPQQQWPHQSQQQGPPAQNGPQGQLNQGNADIHIRTPHVELPTFAGVAPKAWLLECEDIFQLVNIPAENRVRWGLAHIRGQAKTWLNTAGYDLHTLSWATLSQILIDRFPDCSAADPMDQLQQLKQMTSVNMYIDAYEPWMTQMKRERDYLPQDFFAERFVSGLKESIRHNVQC